jgi:hypothetical protein
MSKPRRYTVSTDWGAVICYLIVSGWIVFMTAHLLLAIGDGRLP